MQVFLRRRQFIVNRKLQLRLLVISLSYVVSAQAILAVALFAPVAIHLWTADLDSEQAHSSSLQFLHLHSHFWPAALLSMLAIGLHSILTSHRIAGPLYMLRRILLRIQAGTLPRMRPPRESDLITEEMDQAKKTVDLLRERVSRIKEVYGELDDAIHQDGEAGSDREQLLQAKSKVREMGDALGCFDVEP